VITEERIEQLAYEFVNDSDGTLGDLQNALRNAAEESDRAARQQFTHLYHAVNELMAYMGAHGSAEARGDRAQAVMDALHAIDGGQYQATIKEPTK
jgi:predicted transcriptional regulator